ncbi:hypothetical protein [Aneurinibacillus aneurinilyticus]|uniref:hypothetical protein n=1 Tax=Aneurinibacillus aneurinilyticus TaxID=1391 RepID=UPI0023F4FFD1|nr:hypothetical protein [Aneurinibacillus aneurinilyticus]
MDAKELLSAYAQLGFDSIDTTEKEIAILNYIEQHKETCPEPLYRGIMVDATFKIEVGEKVQFQNLFASFDEDEEVAIEFASRRKKGVVYVLNDAEGLPVYMHTDVCAGETEWLILDREFEVLEVEQSEEYENITLVTIV